MRRFRYSSWKFMLVMFVLIAIFFYDVGFGQSKKKQSPVKEEILSSPALTAEQQIANE